MSLQVILFKENLSLVLYSVSSQDHSFNQVKDIKGLKWS